MTQLVLCQKGKLIQHLKVYVHLPSLIHSDRFRAIKDSLSSHTASHLFRFFPDPFNPGQTKYIPGLGFFFSILTDWGISHRNINTFKI